MARPVAHTRGRIRHRAALLQHWNTPRRWFESGGDGLQALERLNPAAQAYLQQPDWPAVERDLNSLAHTGHHAITLQDAAYPPLLKEIADAPLFQFIQGDAGWRASKQLAIVGSRNPIPAGEQTASEFAEHVAEVVSPSPPASLSVSMPPLTVDH